MAVHLIPVLNDNYVPLIINQGKAIVIDPGLSQPVLNELEERGATLEAILLTHHHWDHLDGAEELSGRTGAIIYGASDKRFHAARCVDEGDCLELAGRTIEIIATPGHTKSHLCYYCKEEEALFTGDTMFSCGCGRLFEGTAEEMYHSFEKLLHYPDHTKVYCAHEYTLDNIAFAHSVEPTNSELLLYRKEVQIKGCSMPSTIGREKQCNPFCRITESAIRERLSMRNAAPADVFAKLRSMKDHF